MGRLGKHLTSLFAVGLSSAALVTAAVAGPDQRMSDGGMGAGDEPKQGSAKAGEMWGQNRENVEGFRENAGVASEAAELTDEARRLPVKGQKATAEKALEELKNEKDAGGLSGKQAYETDKAMRSATKDLTAAEKDLAATERGVLAKAGKGAGFVSTGLTALEVGEASYNCGKEMQKKEGVAAGLKECSGQALDAGKGVALGVIAETGPLGASFSAGYSGGVLLQEGLSYATGKPTLNDQWTKHLADRYDAYTANADCAKAHGQGTTAYYDCIEVRKGLPSRMGRDGLQPLGAGGVSDPNTDLDQQINALVDQVAARSDVALTEANSRNDRATSQLRAEAATAAAASDQVGSALVQSTMQSSMQFVQGAVAARTARPIGVTDRSSSNPTAPVSSGGGCRIANGIGIVFRVDLAPGTSCNDAATTGAGTWNMTGEKSAKMGIVSQ